MMVRMKYILYLVQMAALLGKGMSGITPIPELTTLEGYSAVFGWKFPSAFDILQWYEGDSSGTLIMQLTKGGSPKTYATYPVDYLTGTNSVGMVLKNVTPARASLYTVKVIPTTGLSETSSTNLTILSNGQYDACQSNISVKVNGKVVLESTALQPGNLDITVSMSCVLNNTITVTCTKTSSNDHVNCGNCTGITCVLDTIDAAANDKIALVIIPDLWEGPSFNFSMSVADEKTPLSTGAKVGIGVAVVCISVIMINIVIFVLMKKQTHGNTFCKNNQPTENGKTEQETSKGVCETPCTRDMTASVH